MAVDARNGGAESGWSGLFWNAFRQSKNAMVLVDAQRRHVEVNGAYLQLLGYRRSDLIGRPVHEFVADGPVASAREWRAWLRSKQFSGVAELVRADGGRVTVEFAGHPEIVTGRQLVLGVALRTVRGGRRLQDDLAPPSGPASLSVRELEVIEHIALGLSGPEIADQLQLTHNTVRSHVRNAMTKLGSRSRAQLVAQALGEGIYFSEAA
jgi:PAS domain S-box-containing protein